MPSFDLEVAFREDSVDVADNLLCLGYCFSGATDVIHVHMLSEFSCGFREFCVRKLG